MAAPRQVFDQPCGQYLAPGVHYVSIYTLGNASLWVLESGQAEWSAPQTLATEQYLT